MNMHVHVPSPPSPPHTHMYQARKTTFSQQDRKISYLTPECEIYLEYMFLNLFNNAFSASTER